MLRIQAQNLRTSLCVVLVMALIFIAGCSSSSPKKYLDPEVIGFYSCSQEASSFYYYSSFGKAHPSLFTETGLLLELRVDGTFTVEFPPEDFGQFPNMWPYASGQWWCKGEKTYLRFLGSKEVFSGTASEKFVATRTLSEMGQAVKRSLEMEAETAEKRGIKGPTQKDIDNELRALAQFGEEVKWAQKYTLVLQDGSEWEKLQTPPSWIPWREK